MPSIPQSLLWISLVVLWLFVLVPMLISKRDTVRRTSDVALATRVLNTGAGARLLKRGGPAAGHLSDPDWEPEEEEASSSVAVRTAVDEDDEGDRELDYLDVDVVDEDSGALPVGAVSGESGESGESAEDEPANEWDPTDDEYEYIEDTSGLEAEEDLPTTMEPAISFGASRRRRYDPSTALVVSARKYRFRTRVLLVMALALAASALAAFTVAPGAWWTCAVIGGVMVSYLAYLRRQTRIEARVRSRRMQRMARSRLGVENTSDRDYDVVPSRLRQPGAAVLEIDDEDPVFEHLDYASYARDHDWRRDLPRAAGQ